MENGKGQYQELHVNRLCDSNLCTLNHTQEGPLLNNSHLDTLQTQVLLVKNQNPLPRTHGKVAGRPARPQTSTYVILQGWLFLYEAMALTN